MELEEFVEGGEGIVVLLEGGRGARDLEEVLDALLWICDGLQEFLEDGDEFFPALLLAQEVGERPQDLGHMRGQDEGLLVGFDGMIGLFAIEGEHPCEATQEGGAHSGVLLDFEFLLVEFEGFEVSFVQEGELSPLLDGFEVLGVFVEDLLVDIDGAFDALGELLEVLCDL